MRFHRYIQASNPFKSYYNHYLCAKIKSNLNIYRHLFVSNCKCKSYEIIEPKQWQAIHRTFVSDIETPVYFHTSKPNQSSDACVPKTNHELTKLNNSCRIAKQILTSVGQYLKEGISGEEIDDIVYQLCVDSKCYPSPYNYKGFPKCVTISVNNIAVHGIPDKRKLINGDIVSIDVSIYFDGFHGDCCHTYMIGDVDQKGKHLVNVAQLCLNEAINVCKNGQKFCLIGQTIEKIANENGLNVIPAFCGHGIGRNLHESPQILHYRHQNDSLMTENMVFTIEPVITEGEGDVFVYDDHWTIATEDNCRTAQFEHTICVGKNNAIILTQS